MNKPQTLGLFSLHAFFLELLTTIQDAVINVFFHRPTSPRAHVHTSTSSCCFCFWSSPRCIIFLFWGHGPITLAEMKGPSRAPSKGCTHGSSRCLLCGANKHTWRPSGAITDRRERAKGELGRGWGSVSCVGLVLLQHDEANYLKLGIMNDWWGKKSSWSEDCMTCTHFSIRAMVFQMVNP